MAISPVSKRLKESRLTAGLSQKSLGIAAGIDEFSASARMNQYETGKHTADYSTVSLIAKVLKMPAAYFYADTNEIATMIVYFNNPSKAQKETCLKKIIKLIP